MQIRHQRALALTLVVAMAAALMQLWLGGDADAAGTTPGIFVACAFRSTTVSCPSLDDALAAAAAYPGPATIELEPGSYCPFVIAQAGYPLTIVGMGPAAVDAGAGPPTASTPEAGMTVVRWVRGCSNAAEPAVVTADAGSRLSQPITLRNLTVHGDQPTSSGGPIFGIQDDEMPMTLRDVVVEDATIGIKFTGGDGYGSLRVLNSAILDNPAGGLFACCDTLVAGSTIAGNGGDGVHVDGGTAGYFDEQGVRVRLADDTIAHNAGGLALGHDDGTDNHADVANSIIGDNTNGDCDVATSDFETAGSGSNLLGPDCAGSAPGDQVLSQPISALDPTAPITPAIDPPQQAIGAGDPRWCGTGGNVEGLAVDQEESVEGTAAGVTGCDIGALTPADAGRPLVGVPPVTDLAPIPMNYTGFGYVPVTQAGAGLLAISSVRLRSGGGMRVVGDDCLHAELVPGDTCDVEIKATPGTLPDVSGILVVHTSGGTAQVHVGADATRHPSSLTRPRTRTIRYGSSTTVSTRLVDLVSGRPIAGAVVYLSSTGSQGDQDTIRVVTTHSGVATTTVSPTDNTRYSWQYGGSAVHQDAYAGEWSVQVTRLVRASAYRATVRPSQVDRIYGTVRPGTAGMPVRLEAGGDGAWVVLSSTHTRAQTLPDGRHTVGFVFDHRFGAAPGTRMLRVTSPGSAGYASGASPTLTVVVAQRDARLSRSGS